MERRRRGEEQRRRTRGRLGQQQLPYGTDGATPEHRDSTKGSNSDSERGGGKYLDRVRRQMETATSEPALSVDGKSRSGEERSQNGKAERMGPAEQRARARKVSAPRMDPNAPGDEDPLALVGNGGEKGDRPPSRVKEDPKALGKISVSQQGMSLLLDQ